MKLKQILAGSPAVIELQEGLQRVCAEWRRVCLRVQLQRELTSLDREEERAIYEVEWRQRELHEAEGNLALLQFQYESRRRSLHRRLRDTRPDLAGGR